MDRRNSANLEVAVVLGPPANGNVAYELRQLCNFAREEDKIAPRLVSATTPTRSVSLATLQWST